MNFFLISNSIDYENTWNGNERGWEKSCLHVSLQKRERKGEEKSFPITIIACYMQYMKFKYIFVYDEEREAKA